MRGDVWDEITDQFAKINVFITEVWKRINHFIPHFVMDVITFIQFGILVKSF